MKRFLFVAVFALLGVVSLSAQAVIKFDTISHNFGTFPEEKPLKNVFYFTNTGDKPLVIQQVLTTCGCTVADYTKTKIEPGKRGEIKVTYNGLGKPKGRFQKVISVRSNASNATVRLYIEGYMTVKE